MKALNYSSLPGTDSSSSSLLPITDKGLGLGFGYVNIMRRYKLVPDLERFHQAGDLKKHWEK